MASDRQHLVAVQPFGISSPGGGSRILRALLKDAPIQWTSICTDVAAPPKAKFGREIHLPRRPNFGRIERTRLSGILDTVDALLANRFEQKLIRTCRELGATAIHSIPHSGDFVHCYRVARRLGLPYFLSVHDDLGYAVAQHPARTKIMGSLRKIWCESNEVFVISESLGEEYSARYGRRRYTIVTDGLDSPPEQRQLAERRVRIYFMGLFHLSYENNLCALLRGVDLLRRKFPTVEISVTCRCGAIRSRIRDEFPRLAVLPFASEADVEADLREVDLVYLPLPFGEAYDPFVRYSLSTKLITYLGSGIPILYHGPCQAAAYSLLKESDAAFISDSLNPEEVAVILQQILQDPAQVRTKVVKASELAARQFMLADQRRKFWDGVQRWLREGRLTASAVDDNSNFSPHSK